MTTDNPATLDDARAQWADAVTLSDELLGDLLDVAWERCELFLPAELVTAYGDGGDAPKRWVQAVVLDARDTWQAFRRDGDVIGFDTYAVRVRPLSDTVAGMLRPRRGVPMVG